jgi:hypothetical protein
MSENFSFVSEMKDCSMPQTGKKGKYYKAKTEQGTVNIPVEVIEGQPEIGKKYKFEGVISEYPYTDPKTGSTEQVKSKWATLVIPAVGAPPVPAPIPGIGDHPTQQQVRDNAMITGHALNMAARFTQMEMTTADDQSETAVERCLRKWYKFSRRVSESIQNEELDILHKGF